MSNGNDKLRIGLDIEPIIEEGLKDPLTRIGRRIVRYSVKEDGTDNYFPVPCELLDFAHMTKSKWKAIQSYIVKYKCAKIQEFNDAAGDAHDDYIQYGPHILDE